MHLKCNVHKHVILIYSVNMCEWREKKEKKNLWQWIFVFFFYISSFLTFFVVLYWSEYKYYTRRREGKMKNFLFFLEKRKVYYFICNNIIYHFIYKYVTWYTVFVFIHASIVFQSLVVFVYSINFKCIPDKVIFKHFNCPFVGITLLFLICNLIIDYYRL